MYDQDTAGIRNSLHAVYGETAFYHTTDPPPYPQAIALLAARMK